MRKPNQFVDGRQTGNWVLNCALLCDGSVPVLALWQSLLPIGVDSRPISHFSDAFLLNSSDINHLPKDEADTGALWESRENGRLDACKGRKQGHVYAHPTP